MRRRRERPRQLLRTPLAAWERDGLKAALTKAGLPAGDVDDAHILFWRFESYEDVPVGFGGLELHGDDALLRSVLTLPPLRQIGIGSAIVSALEAEARAHSCRAIYLLTASHQDFFSRLGYTRCAHAKLPQAIRDRGQAGASAEEAAMVKHLS
ncbi:MAG TPA: GNAT family N-acetyltransferase [Xanthobacteraceae bacterium]